MSKRDDVEAEKILDRHELFETIYNLLKHSKPHGLEVEVFASFIQDIESPYWDGDYNLSAQGALYDWDI